MQTVPFPPKPRNTTLCCGAAVERQLALESRDESRTRSCSHGQGLDRCSILATRKSCGTALQSWATQSPLGIPGRQTNAVDTTPIPQSGWKGITQSVSSDSAVAAGAMWIGSESISRTLQEGKPGVQGVQWRWRLCSRATPSRPWGPQHHHSARWGHNYNHRSSLPNWNPILRCMHHP